MRVLLSHGDGGALSHQLTAEIFRPAFCDSALDEEGDAALLPSPAGELAISTDSYVIHPLRFPGGDIGKLAVAGTVNDLAVSGATPLYLTVGFILEEGLPLEQLRQIVASMAQTARAARVRIVAGDTKVVERGKGDGLYVNTTGVGHVRQPGRLGPGRIQPGDRVLINGGIAEHAVAVLSERAGLRFATPVVSDCAPLNHMIAAALAEFRTIRFMRDPTRGGVATALKEIASRARCDMAVEEERLPVRPEIKGALELLGMEPWYLANEGKVLMIVGPDEADALVAFLRQYPGQELAEAIGTVTPGVGNLWLKTPFGGTRNLGLLSGAPLPRIC
ncbi:MAG TPA: hydrogenase expression/formation protein HypE [Symbiobacteriaceae bacterium]|nr:hydrogenase expression/formation protein HypE [Symbiobacteriaceae bacterium]